MLRRHTLALQDSIGTYTSDWVVCFQQLGRGMFMQTVPFANHQIGGQRCSPRGRVVPCGT